MQREIGVAFVAAGAIGLLLAGASPLRSQEPDEPDEPDPCAHVQRQGDVNVCWATEAVRADTEMKEAYNALLAKLPHRAAENLKKAQRLWLDYREAHVATLYGAPNPFRVYGPAYPTCLSIARRQLTLARTKELMRLLQPDPDDLCPL